jgi:hypothetical protein
VVKPVVKQTPLKAPQNSKKVARIEAVAPVAAK